MLMLLARFLAGGIIVASVPWLAQRFGPAWAAIILLVPAITFIGLAFTWAGAGRDTAASVAAAGIFALPAVAAFMLIFAVAAKANWPAWSVFAAAVIAWLLMAAVILKLRS